MLFHADESEWRTRILGRCHLNVVLDVIRFREFHPKRNLEGRRPVRRQKETAVFPLANVGALALAIKEVRVKLNFLPGNRAGILDRSHDGNGWSGSQVAEGDLALCDDYLVLVALVVLTPIENSRAKEQQTSGGKKGKENRESRVIHDHRPTILEMRAKRTFPGFIRNLHAAHFAGLFSGVSIHKSRDWNVY